MNNTPDPRLEVSRIHIESYKRALKELTREELETFALVEYGLVIFYCCHVLGEDSPNVGNLTAYGIDYDWLNKITDEIINKLIRRSAEIADEIKRGN